MKIFNKKLFLFIFIVAIAGTLLYVLLFRSSNMAPNIEIKKSDGVVIKLNKPLRPVLVNFWATTCPSCISEMPHMAEMKRKLGDNLDIIAMSMSYDSIEQVQNFIDKNDYPFIFVADSMGNYARSFGKIYLTPTSFLINRQGKIIYQKIGTIDFNLVTETVKQLNVQK